MSEGKHTPGPWQLNDLSVESSSEGKWIACTDSHMGNDLCEDQANARLISAAPELLKAAQDLLQGYTAARALKIQEAIKKAKRE